MARASFDLYKIPLEEENDSFLIFSLSLPDTVMAKNNVVSS